MTTRSEKLKMSLSEVVRALLKQRNWSQAELERRTGINHGTMAVFMTNPKRGMSYEHMRAIAGAFGLDHTDDLYEMALTGNLGKIRQDLSLVRYPDKPIDAMWMIAKKAVEEAEKIIPIPVPVFQSYLGPRTKPFMYIMSYPKECLGHNMEAFVVNAHCKDVFPRLWPNDIIVIDYDIKATPQDLVVVNMPGHANWYCGVYLPVTDDKSGNMLHWVENKSGRHITNIDDMHVVVSMRRDMLHNPNKEWIPALKDYPEFPGLKWAAFKDKENE